MGEPQLRKMTKSKSIEKLSAQKKIAEDIIHLRHGNDTFKKWRRDTEIAIERIFGKETRHFKDFTQIDYSSCVGMPIGGIPDSEWQNRYKEGIKSAIIVLSSFIDEINEDCDEEQSDETLLDTSAIAKIELIIRNFHSVARKLQLRYSNRSTIEINDEYDVQYLFSALLCLYFEDIRPEEYTPSYAGSASRVDFLLKKEKIVIEIKKTRQNLEDKQIGEQLIIDAQRYRSHPDCERLICFVYDPEEKIKNPRGIENDLTREFDGLPVSVFITPH